MMEQIFIIRFHINYRKIIPLVFNRIFPIITDNNNIRFIKLDLFHSILIKIHKSIKKIPISYIDTIRFHQQHKSKSQEFVRKKEIFLNSSCQYSSVNLPNGIYNLSQCEMINGNNSMNIDLYGLSMSPSTINPHGSPPPPPTTDHSNHILNDLSSPCDSKQNSPVIYPWMRKVHINNPGNRKLFSLVFIKIVNEAKRLNIS